MKLSFDFGHDIQKDHLNHRYKFQLVENFPRFDPISRANHLGSPWLGTSDVISDFFSTNIIEIIQNTIAISLKIN